MHNITEIVELDNVDQEDICLRRFYFTEIDCWY